MCIAKKNVWQKELVGCNERARDSSGQRLACAILLQNSHGWLGRTKSLPTDGIAELRKTVIPTDGTAELRMKKTQTISSATEEFSRQ